MAGTFPSTRRRRLAPLPCVSRNSAPITNEMRIFELLKSPIAAPCGIHATPRPRGHDQRGPLSTLCGSRPYQFLVHVQRTDGLFRADAPDGLREERRYRQLPDTPQLLRGFRQRDGVSHHQLIEYRLRDALERLARKQRVGDV